MRALPIAVLGLALAAAPAHAAPFGKARTLGTTPIAYEYEIFAADGPGGGVAFYSPAEKQVGVKRTQRLLIARVEGNGSAHRLTTTRYKGFAPGRAYDGGPPYADFAVGPRWRMLTTEYRKGRVFGISNVFSFRIAPNGRRVGEQLVGPDSKASPFFGANARGDAVSEYGDDGFTIARRAGRFVPAPKTLDRDEHLPRITDDGSLYDFRATDDGGRAVLRSSGRRWGKPQTVVPGGLGTGVLYRDVVTSRGGDALLVYGNAESVFDSNLTARWSRRRGRFGPPIALAPSADPLSVTLDAIPGGRYAVRWRDKDESRDADPALHLMVARRWGRPFRAVATWNPAGNTSSGPLVPLRDGRTLVAWKKTGPEGRGPHRLMATVINSRGKIGKTQTIAKSRFIENFSLRRLGRGNRAALVWTDLHGRKKRFRIAVMR